MISDDSRPSDSQIQFGEIVRGEIIVLCAENCMLCRRDFKLNLFNIEKTNRVTQMNIDCWLEYPIANWKITIDKIGQMMTT